MIYATLKRGVIDAASNEAGVEVDKKVGRHPSTLYDERNADSRILAGGDESARDYGRHDR